MNKKKLIGTIIGVILFAILIAGATFALLSRSIRVTNGIYNITTICFDIDYSNGGIINGQLDYLHNPIAGLNTSITMGINSSCNISGNANIYLNVSNDTDEIFISTADPHCESNTNLATLSNYTDSITCENNSGTWVTNGTALKYAIYNTNSPTTSTVPLSMGYLNTTGDNLIYEDLSLSQGSTTTYYVYIWLDGALATYDHMGKHFSGYIHTTATQIEE